MNQFDNLSGVPNRGEDLAGLGSKLKKAVKKIAKVPKKIVAEVKRSPIAKAALVVGAGVLLAPAAGALAGKLGIGKALTGTAAKSLATSAVKKTAVQSIGGKLLKIGKKAVKAAPAAAAVVGTGLTVASAVGQAKAAKEAKRLARSTGDSAAQQALTDSATPQIAEKIRRRIGKKTPEFERLVATRKAQGKTDSEIAQEWAASKSFVDTTEKAVASQIEGDIVSQLINRGMPQQQAQSYAPQIAQEIGRDTGQQLQNDFGGINIKHVGIGAAILAGVYLINRKPSRKGA